MINCMAKGAAEGSQGFSNAFADNHSNRVYIAYPRSEDKRQLLSDMDYVSPLTRVSQDTVASFFSHLDERELPQSWRNFRDLMWKIERHHGIRTVGRETFLVDVVSLTRENR